MPRNINLDWEVRDDEAKWSDMDEVSPSESQVKESKHIYGEIGYAATATLVAGVLIFAGGRQWSNIFQANEDPMVEVVPTPKVGGIKVLPTVYDDPSSIPEIPLGKIGALENNYSGVGGIHSGETSENGMRYSLFIDSVYLKAPLSEDFHSKLKELLKIANYNVDENAANYMNGSSITLMYLMESEGECVEHLFKYRSNPVSPRYGFFKTFSCPFDQIGDVSLSEKEAVMGMLRMYLQIAHDFNKDSDDAEKIWKAFVYASHGVSWLEYTMSLGLQGPKLGMDDYERIRALLSHS